MCGAPLSRRAALQHRHVTALHVSYNKLAALPAELARLEALTLLGTCPHAGRAPPGAPLRPRAALTASGRADATHNKISEVHELVCTLPRLGALELAFNCLRCLPDGVGKLTSLDRLTLQVCAHAPRCGRRPGGVAMGGGAVH